MACIENMNKQNHASTKRQSGRQKKTTQKTRQIILFNKPFGVLCQFSPDANNPTLKNYIDAPGFYAAGRLDKDSEGLLVLTNNGRLQHEISHPLKKLPKTYMVQLEGKITDEAIQQLKHGIALKDGLTRPAIAEPLIAPEWLWPRIPPIRIRATIPTSWIKLQITEGKNRQVRRMTAAIGFPTLRLVRYSVGSWTVEKLKSGEWVADRA